MSLPGCFAESSTATCDATVSSTPGGMLLSSYDTVFRHLPCATSTISSRLDTYHTRYCNASAASEYAPTAFPKPILATLLTALCSQCKSRCCCFGAVACSKQDIGLKSNYRASRSQVAQPYRRQQISPHAIRRSPELLREPGVQVFATSSAGLRSA